MNTAAGVQPHNEKPAAILSSGGAKYDQVSRGIADSIEHGFPTGLGICVPREYLLTIGVRR